MKNGDIFAMKETRLKANALLKRTVCECSSVSPCKDENVRFTTVHLKALSDQVWIKHPFILGNWLFFILVS